MTILSAVQDACKMPSMGIYPAPTALFSSTDQLEVELCTLANETAKMVAKAHDWRALATLKTQAGDAATTAFTLPTDYDHMPVKASVFYSASARPMTRIDDLDMWQLNRLQGISNPEGEWMILGGYLNIYVGGQAMTASVSAKYYYQSNLIVHPATGANKADFTIDTDTFRLPERLLTLGLVMKWRSEKGLDYQQELADFQLAFAQEASREKGSRMIMIGQARIPDGAMNAFPGTINA